MLALSKEQMNKGTVSNIKICWKKSKTIKAKLKTSTKT